MNSVARFVRAGDVVVVFPVYSAVFCAARSRLHCCKSTFLGFCTLLIFFGGLTVFSTIKLGVPYSINYAALLGKVKSCTVAALV